MNRPALIVFTLLVSLATPSFAAKSERPNILYFYVDDMGWGAIGPNGQAERKAKGLPYVMTPNLDRLAAQGVNFTRSYGCTVCSPARSSQQTGFHQGHTFADRNDPNNAKKAIRTEDLTMGDMLSRAGYVTGYWGKWGYGGSKSQEDPTIDNVQTLPTSHGYQHVVAELHHVRAHTFFQPTLWTAPAQPNAIGGLELKPNSMKPFVGKKNYPDTPALQNHPEYPTTAYCDDVYAFAALDFVRQQSQNYRRTGQPFFGLLAVQVPHAPFGEIEQLPEWDRAYRSHPHFSRLSEQARQWAAMVTRIDAHFGNILAALEDPNGDGDKADSVADNTLVIFQSDNGGPQHPARDEFVANGGLRSSKGKIQEGGIRIPTVMRWPAKITKQSRLKAGTSTSRIIDVTDLLPTFCDLAQVPTPLGIDGVSLAPTLTGSGHQRRREFLIHEAGNGQSIIRGKDKLVRTKQGFELYDLAADHGEKHDLAAAQPELVAELTELLLGERVAEKRGFSNTYHHWTGGKDAQTSDPDSWSDYDYANVGVSYQKDAGAPQLSWVARMENGAAGSSQVRADTDLEFLSLEISGRQVLELGADVNLTGRNEIRLAAKSTLAVKGGTVFSQRWIDVKSATLRGHGTIAAEVYNQGMVMNRGGTLAIGSDYHELAGSRLTCRLGEKDQVALNIAGTANLAGALSVQIASGFKPEAGRTYTVVKAGKINGTFRNKTVTTKPGTRFQIGYTPTSVTLTVR
jgi:arylsulfatase A-like enzyme